jgi:hypothetical protein
MKKLLVGLTVLSCSQVFAQTSPSDVCRNISRFSASSGSQCAQVISRSRLDQTVLNVANAVANTGSSANALKILEVGANRQMDPSLEVACLSVARFSQSSAVTCVEASLDSYFSPAASIIAKRIADTGSSANAVLAIQNARGAYLQDSASETCLSIARFSQSTAAACVSAIANKEYFNGSEGVCLDLANRGSSASALTCLQNSGVEYNPLPPMPTEIVMTTVQFMDISRDVRRAENLLSRGNRFEAQRILNDVSRVLEEVNIQNGSSRGGPGRGGRRN